MNPGAGGPAGGPQPPDIVRCTSVELGVTDLDRARWFYADVLGLVVTHADADAVHLRTFEEFIHHNLVLRRTESAGVITMSYRVREPADVDRAEEYFAALGCATDRRRGGYVRGVGDTVRIVDPLGFPCEFFCETEHVERLAWRYDLQPPGAVMRMDHVNLVTPDVERGVGHLESLGFRVTENIVDAAGGLYAAWLRRKPTVHDVALTGGDGPRLHHFAFTTHEKHSILSVCDKLGSLRLTDHIERGPGRHGVSNAFYLYLRDPDGHRVELYTQDYYTGDPDNPVVSWDVHDNQRRDWWGNPVIPSWYTEASTVFDLDGNPQPLRMRVAKSELAATLGADGFWFTAEQEH